MNENPSSRRASSITSASYYSPSSSVSPSPSDDESGAVAQKAAGKSGVDRHHQIPTAEARSRFRPARVDTDHVDFSDRIHKPGKREPHRSYRVGWKQRSDAKKVRRRERTREPDQYEAPGEESEGSSVVSELETLEEKIARLKREIEEVKGEAERRGDTEGENKRDFGITELSDILRDVSLAKNSTALDQQVHQSSAQADGEAKQQDEQQEDVESTGDRKITRPPHPPQQRADLDANTLSTLHKASTLESRLSSLENALGLHNLAVPLPSSTNSNSTTTTMTTTTTVSKTSTSNTASTQPVLTTLTLLERQLQHLTTTHLPSLNTASTTLQKLTADADKLTESRKAATQATKDLSDANANAALLMQQQNARPSYHRAGQDSFDASRPSTAATAATRMSPTKSSFPARRPSSMSFAAGGAATPGAPQESEGLAPEQAALLKRLSAHLPAIDALAPLLPLTLERLKSLSRVHVDAGTALGDLKQLEGRQAGMGRELREWREGLEGLEGRMREVGGGSVGNRNEVERWVAQIEERIGKVVG